MNSLVCIAWLLPNVEKAADTREVFSYSWSTTAPTMSGGSLGKPHAIGRQAAHPWDSRVYPLVRDREICENRATNRSQL